VGARVVVAPGGLAVLAVPVAVSKSPHTGTPA